MKGFSPRNLAFMGAFAAAWPGEQILQQPVGQLPWGHITVLLDRLDDHDLRDWYAGQAAVHGWSRNVLDHQIRSAAHTRLQAAPTNFAEVLPPRESDLAQQITKDSYVLDFLALDGDAKKRHLEQALVDRIIVTLRELGEGSSSRTVSGCVGNVFRVVGPLLIGGVALPSVQSSYFPPGSPRS